MQEDNDKVVVAWDLLENRLKRLERDYAEVITELAADPDCERWKQQARALMAELRGLVDDQTREKDVLGQKVTTLRQHRAAAAAYGGQAGVRVQRPEKPAKCEEEKHDAEG